MNTGIEELREQMEHASAGIAVPGGLARRARSTGGGGS
jgi:hypothetical protein